MNYSVRPSPNAIRNADGRKIYHFAVCWAAHSFNIWQFYFLSWCIYTFNIIGLARCGERNVRWKLFVCKLYACNILHEIVMCTNDISNRGGTKESTTKIDRKKKMQTRAKSTNEKNREKRHQVQKWTADAVTYSNFIIFFCHKLLPVDERAVSKVDEMMCKFSMKLLVWVHARSCLLKLVECGLVRTFFCMHIRNAKDGLPARNSFSIIS